MTDSMVERVARALCAEDGTDPDGLDSQGQVWWTCYEDSARAAIAAMRTPTEAMVTAAREMVWDFSPDYAPIDIDPECQHADSAESVGKRTWQAMIDTALEQRGLEG